ncbi:helix-turn-helix domain-containing protein [Leptospira kanakyensis]|uniref:helix-turn-helix domain-containing protein n=1 Tax=Leptospira kanakyensis TaxID=2484968 RepID=UPI00223C941A|nr:helix-turn-helix transcriptional regulator [Leptospira kanakyensis]MCW7470559.1 helix-turn-helix domain-containing protein [Leptospira kanakyensis]
MNEEESKIILAEFSKNLIKIRKKQDKSQEETSGLELSVRNYQKIEKGESFPSFKSLLIISKNLEIDPSILLDIPSIKKFTDSKTKKSKNPLPQK